MTRTPWRLIWRHATAHWLRTGLTLTAMTVAIFLFCFLLSIVTSMNLAVTQSAANRVIVQSAVSLFVELPLDYQPKIAAVPGVEVVSKFQWFGGYYQDPANFFAQFAIDHEIFFDQYARDLDIVEGPRGSGGDLRAAVRAAMAAERRACVIGPSLAREFKWKIGDTIPIIGTIFPKKDGGAWEFVVVGIYRPLKSNMDERTIFFRFDYLDETLRNGGATGPLGVVTYAVNVTPGTDPAGVIAGIDKLFENGPQRTMTATEAAFQAGFLSMMGNLPLFLGTIGGAVIFAVFFSVVNTMLMATRQRSHETGILKALGFSSGVLARLVLAESLFQSLLGGGAGVVFALLSAPGIRQGVNRMIPNYVVEPTTVAWAAGISLLIGFAAGIGPAVRFIRLSPTEALKGD